MKVNELPKVFEEDNLLIQIEQLKVGLITQATGNSMDNEEYKRIRKLILNMPNINNSIPNFLKVCRTNSDFEGWIKGEAGTYKERREIIRDALNPLLNYVENKMNLGSFEFQNNYNEKEIIGNGGFGQVYLYEHNLLKMQFAVKVFAPAFYAGGDRELERFFQEARMLFKLNHPSIIKVYDAGLIEQRPFIRMEYFRGLNLNETLTKYGSLSPKLALIMMKNITSGVNHAHEVGIIHRDLKPSNIMSSRPNQFRIIDFGLGVFVENELYSRLTKTGESSVSGYYNAPELIQNPRLIDKRSDIYSLGAIWYTMLIGQPPAGTSILKNLQNINGLNERYINCIINCLANIELRTVSCEVLLDQISELESKFI